MNKIPDVRKKIKKSLLCTLAIPLPSQSFYQAWYLEAK